MNYPDGKLFLYNGAGWNEVWQHLEVKYVSMGTDDIIWYVTQNNQLWAKRISDPGFSRQDVPFNITYIDVQYLNNIVAVDSSDNVLKFDGSTWTTPSDSGRHGRVLR